MVKTLLFDLDGTLLPMDTDAFAYAYIDLLAEKVNSSLNIPNFTDVLWEATFAMVNDSNPHKLNKEVFWDNFLSSVSYDENVLNPIFDNFYNNDFPTLSHIVSKENSLPYEIVDTAIKNDFEIVIATNPVFPKEAIMERLRWVNIHNFPYTLITTYENMHFAKPNIEYYGEILKKINRKPKECIMFGNDVDEDLIAGKIGIKTYLVMDYIINRENRDIDSDYRGSLKDVVDFIELIANE